MEQIRQFNFSLETLSRINELIKDTQYYSINENYLAMRNNLKELVKEVNPFLHKRERTKLLKDWHKIKEEIIEIDDEGIITLDNELINKMDNLTLWIMKKLVEHKISYHKSELLRGYEQIRTSYKIKDNENG